MGQKKIDPRVLQETNVSELNLLSVEFGQTMKAEYNAAVIEAQKNGWTIRQELEDGTIIQLRKLDENGSPIYYSTDNATSAMLINTDDAQALELTGTGINIGEWDGGDIRSTHEQYSGRVINNDGVAISSHSTHVCGTMIGDGTGNAAAMGMAPGATVDGYDFTNSQWSLMDLRSQGCKVEQLL